jgi:hypothetical protein
MGAVKREKHPIISLGEKGDLKGGNLRIYVVDSFLQDSYGKIHLTHCPMADGGARLEQDTGG